MKKIIILLFSTITFLIFSIGIHFFIYTLNTPSIKKATIAIVEILH